MSSLATEFRQLLARRIERAAPAEILAIANALCADTAKPLIVAPQDGVEIPRFTLLSDETVLDNKTDLVWSRSNVGSGRLNWKAAKEACTACRLDGMSDWRLPTIQELLSIVDYSRSEPAIDPLFRCESAYYWSATPYAPNSGDCAWDVYFYSGNSYYNNQDDDYYVRAVRPRQ